MQVSEQVVEHVAQLAQLSLDAEERAYYQQQLNKILIYIDKLESMPLQPALKAGSLHPANESREREDAVMVSLSPEQALSNAPARVGSALQVPRIIEN